MWMQWRCIWRVDTNTRLNINMKMIHQKSEIEDVIKACNSWTCRCRKCSSTRGYCLHNRTSANGPSLHKPVHRLLKHEHCFGELNTTRIVRCTKPAKDRKHHCKTASGETGRWWRQIDGHWSWRGARRLRKGPRGHCRTNDDGAATHHGKPERENDGWFCN